MPSSAQLPPASSPARGTTICHLRRWGPTARVRWYPRSGNSQAWRVVGCRARSTPPGPERQSACSAPGGATGFLEKLTLQDHAASDNVARDGRCQLVLGSPERGSIAGHHSRLAGHCDVSVRLPPFSLEDLEALHEIACTGLNLTRSELRQINDAAGGRPGVALRLIDGVGQSGGRYDSKDRVLAYLRRYSADPREDQELRNYLESVQQHSLGRAVLAATMWDGCGSCRPDR